MSAGTFWSGASGVLLTPHVEEDGLNVGTLVHCFDDSYGLATLLMLNCGRKLTRVILREVFEEQHR